MQIIETTRMEIGDDEIVEIEATELELREDLVGSLGSLFSCCCPNTVTSFPG